MDSKHNKLQRTKSTLITTKVFENINEIINKNNNRILSQNPDLVSNRDELRDPKSSSKRPQSALLRGVKITDLNESWINPEPIFTDNDGDFLGNYLSPYKLQALTGKTDLKKVTYLQLKVNMENMTISNIGAYLPNLHQLRFTDSIIPTIRDLGTTMRSLSVLWMKGCGLGDLDGLPSLTTLSELYLSFNRLSDISSCSLLQNLSTLDLESNNISSMEQLSFLSFCPRLWNVTLQGNPICLKPEPTNAPPPSDYDYRQSATESIGGQLKLLDAVHVNKYTHDSTVNQNNGEIEEIDDFHGRACSGSGKDRDSVMRLKRDMSLLEGMGVINEPEESVSDLASNGHVMCGNISKVLKSCRTGKHSNPGSQLQECNMHGSSNNTNSLDVEIEAMKKDIKKSMSKINHRKEPDGLKVHSDDDTNADDDENADGDGDGEGDGEGDGDGDGDNESIKSKFSERVSGKSRSKRIHELNRIKYDISEDKGEGTDDNGEINEEDYEYDKNRDDKTKNRKDEKTNNNNDDNKDDNNKDDNNDDDDKDEDDDDEDEDDEDGDGRQKVCITAENYEEVLRELSLEDGDLGDLKGRRQRLYKSIDFFTELAQNPVGLNYMSLSGSKHGRDEDAKDEKATFFPFLEAPKSLSTLSHFPAQSDMVSVDGNSIKGEKGLKKKENPMNLSSDKVDRRNKRFELPSIRTHLKPNLEGTPLRKQKGKLMRNVIKQQCHSSDVDVMKSASLYLNTTPNAASRTIKSTIQ